jgi:protein SCO1/2
MVIGTIALFAILLALLLSRTTGADAGFQTGDSGFAGALRPDVPAKDFALADQDGHTISTRNFRGTPVILTFMYSTCEDTCPLLASTIREALDRLGRDFPAIAVSVDPVNDTPQSARQFLLKRSMTGRMSFLLGTKKQLEPVWKNYGVQPQLGPGGGVDPLKDHSSVVILLDKKGRQRISFPLDHVTAEGLAHDVKALDG